WKAAFLWRPSPQNVALAMRPFVDSRRVRAKEYIEGTLGRRQHAGVEGAEVVVSGGQSPLGGGDDVATHRAGGRVVAAEAGGAGHAAGRQCVAILEAGDRGGERGVGNAIDPWLRIGADSEVGLIDSNVGALRRAEE